ncbi:MAG: IS630 family transposase, partial [Holosporaceae bacterium]|nr:IS630 family transposase [Holosporaceae bacterium]
MKDFLTEEEVYDLMLKHRREKERRVADRIKAVLLSNQGWSFRKIAEALFLDEDTISKHVSEYRQERKLGLLTGGSESKMSSTQTQELVDHIASHSYTKVSEICNHIRQKYGLEYTVSGMTKWLKSNGFSFIRPHGVPAKADPEKQKQFVSEYEKLKNETPENESILFCDGVHPTMATKTTYGWIKKGSRKPIKATASRTRMNILGAINLTTMDVITDNFKAINSEAMRDFFDL